MAGCLCIIRTAVTNRVTKQSRPKGLRYPCPAERATDDPRSLWTREWWLTCIALAFMSDVPRTWNILLPSLSYVSSSDPARNPAPLPPCEQPKSQVLVFVSWMKYFNTFPLLLFAFYTQDYFSTHERQWSLNGRKGSTSCLRLGWFPPPRYFYVRMRVVYVRK